MNTRPILALVLAALAFTEGMAAWTYILQKSYGSPEVDQATPEIVKAAVAPDRKSVRLTITGLVRGHVHPLDSKRVKSAAGKPLWHPDAWYALNEIPDAQSASGKTAGSGTK